MDEKVELIMIEEKMDGELKIPEYGYSPEQALKYLKMILNCYQGIYKAGKIHRDLKPGNLLMKKINGV